MRLAANLTPDGAGPLAEEAERLGYDLLLAAEGYRADAVSVLGLVAGRTTRIALGSGVMQIPARPPGTAALTAATLDALSGGRFRLGLGVSNPHVSDGWYGVDFADPLGRTREYVGVVRRALTGEPVRNEGPHFPLPRRGHGNAPLTVPARPDLPIYLGASGPRSLRLAGEIADGWLSGFTTPELVARSVARIGAGRATMRGFDVIPFVAIAVADDPREAAAELRRHYAHLLGIGGEDNFYARLARELGYDREIDDLQRCLKAGDGLGAARAVPFGFVDRTALLGPIPRIAERMREFRDAGVTHLSIMVSANDGDAAARLRLLRYAAEAAELAG
jgi:F420-dependent oxidoreductase-like protein